MSADRRPVPLPRPRTGRALHRSPALVFTPHGRDAEITLDLLRQAGVAANLCGNFQDLLKGVGEDASFAVVAEEGLQGVDLSPLQHVLEVQPAWSDFQFLVLT